MKIKMSLPFIITFSFQIDYAYDEFISHKYII